MCFCWFNLFGLSVACICFCAVRSKSGFCWERGVDCFGFLFLLGRFVLNLVYIFRICVVIDVKFCVAFGFRLVVAGVCRVFSYCVFGSCLFYWEGLESLSSALYILGGCARKYHFGLLQVEWDCALGSCVCFF